MYSISQTLNEDLLEKLLRLDLTCSERKRSSSNLVSAVPIQKTRGELLCAVAIFLKQAATIRVTIEISKWKIECNSV